MAAFISRRVQPTQRRAQIVLKGEDEVLDFLCLQVLDILHDSGRMVTSKTVESVAYLVALWISVFNFSDQSNAERAHARIIERIMARLGTHCNLSMGGDPPPIAEKIKKRRTVQWIPQLAARMLMEGLFIADTCGPMKCDCMMSENAFATWSVVYDNGATITACQNSEKFYTMRNETQNEIPADLLDFEEARHWKQYVFNSFPSLPCRFDLGLQVSNIGTDTYVIGTMGALLGDAPSVKFEKLQPCVLAWRGQFINYCYDSRTRKKVPIGVFSFRVTPNKILQHAHSPTRNWCVRIAAKWFTRWEEIKKRPNPVPTQEDKTYALYAYTELIAKHWGDLGLAADAADAAAMGVSTYVITADKALCAICSLFGVPVLFDGQFVGPIEKYAQVYVEQVTAYISNLFVV